MVVSYYALVRKAIQWVAFPGSFAASKAALEMQFNFKLADYVINALSGYRQLISYFIMNETQELDAERSVGLILESAIVKNLVKQLTGQMTQLYENRQKFIDSHASSSLGNIDHKQIEKEFSINDK